MKIFKFNEYVNNNEDDSYIKFNRNEIKYFELKADFCEINNEYYLNGRLIRKLSNNEYQIGKYDPLINCSTVQTAIKYSYDSTLNIKNDIINIINDSEVKTERLGSQIFSDYINNTLGIWATYYVQDNRFEFNSRKLYPNYIYDKYKITLSELVAIMEIVINNIPNLENSLITYY